MADNKDILTCPACGEEMQKIFFASIQKNIDICLKGCGGMFFDNREFEKIDEQHENIDEILSLISNRTFKQVDDKELRICPYCHANMVKTNIFGVLIDTCYTCGGKFLDNNELEQYRNQYPSDSERSKVFHAMFGQKLKEVIAQSSEPNSQLEIEQANKLQTFVLDSSNSTVESEEVQGEEIVYAEPPMNPLKRLVIKLFNR